MTLTYDTYGLALQTVAEYAKARRITDRTVKRWLAAGELPGAQKDEQGRWLIPADADRTEASGQLVALEQTRQLVEQLPAPRSLDELPSFLSIELAARILDISQHAITTHRDYFGVVPFGPNGSLVVPLATIKKIRG